MRWSRRPLPTASLCQFCCLCLGCFRGRWDGVILRLLGHFRPSFVEELFLVIAWPAVPGLVRSCFLGVDKLHSGRLFRGFAPFTCGYAGPSLWVFTFASPVCVWAAPKGLPEVLESIESLVSSLPEPLPSSGAVVLDSADGAGELEVASGALWWIPGLRHLHRIPHLIGLTL